VLTELVPIRFVIAYIVWLPVVEETRVNVFANLNAWIRLYTQILVKRQTRGCQEKRKYIATRLTRNVLCTSPKNIQIVVLYRPNLIQYK